MNTATRVIALFLPIMVLSSCQKDDEQELEPPRPILSVIVEPVSTEAIMVSGTVEARIETQFGFRVLGRVISRNVQVGDLVKRGDVLAAIDPLVLELAVKSARSDLANSEARYANALITEQRQKTLFERQSGAKAVYETAEQERKTAEASVATARANLDKATEQLGYSRLLAEFDGVVTQTSAEVGQVVSAGQAVATVARPEERDAVVDLADEGGERLAPGATFLVSLQLDPTVQAKGILREIAPEADDATRTRRTKLTLVDPPAALRLGSVISASAVVGAHPAIRLPSSAIRIDGAEKAVWVANDETGKVSLRAVTLDGEFVAGATVTVTGGLKSGERVVVAGVNKLKDGQTVRIDQEMTK